MMGDNGVFSGLCRRSSLSETLLVGIFRDWVIFSGRGRQPATGTDILRKDL